MISPCREIVEVFKTPSKIGIFFLEIFIYIFLRTVVSNIMLQTQNLGVGQVNEPCIGVNTRELNRKLYTRLFTLYTKRPWSMLILLP